MINVAPSTIRVHHNLHTRCARCAASCSATVYEIGGAPALPFPAGGRAALDAAKAVLDDYRAPKAARAKARRDLDRLLSWWCRLTPEQAMAAQGQRRSLWTTSQSCEVVRLSCASRRDLSSSWVTLPSPEVRMSRLIVSAAALSFFVACAPAGVDMPFDSDGDGLMDLDEQEVGTDPFVADSDGDGHLDGLEFEQGADPLNADDHPYKGGYGGIDRSCKAEVSATGNEEGAVTDNFALLDQYGEDVALWDFCGRAVLLVAGAFWCGSCQAEVPHMQELYETYADRGLMVIGLYSETEETGVIPTAEDLQRWSDTYGTTFPVLADDAAVWTRFEKDYGIPSLTLLAPGAVVVSADGGSVDSMLDEVLPK